MRARTGTTARVSCVLVLISAAALAATALGATTAQSPLGHVARVDVTPPSATVQLGSTLNLHAIAYDGHGTDISHGVVWSWQVHGSIGTVSGSGQDATFTATTVGTGAVSAYAEHNGTGKHGVSNITVSTGGHGLNRVEIHPGSATLPVAGTQQFTARAFDGSGNDISSQVSWSWTSAGSIGSVDQSGLFTASTAGTGSVAAEANDGANKASAGAHVTVSGHPPEIWSVAITPNAASLTVGGTQQFSAQAFDQYGQPLHGAAYSWSVHGTIGSVDQSGLFSATTAGDGHVLVDASSGGKTVSGHAPVHVGTGHGSTIHTVVVDPHGATVKVNGTQQFHATALDAHGNPVPGATFTWSVQPAQGLGTVDQTGIFTGLAVGHGKVIAETAQGGQTFHGSADAAVTGHLVRVSGKVTDADGKAVAGATVKFTAEATGEVADIVLTSSQGSYDADLSPSSTFTQQVSASGYEPFSSEVNTGDEDKTGVNAIVRQAPRPGTPGLGPWLLGGAVGGGVLAGIALAAFMYPEALLLALVWVPMVLAARMRKEQVLDHFDRGQIYGYIVANPGTTMMLIHRALKVSLASLPYHLHTLEREGFLRSQKEGRHRRFFSIEKAPSAVGALLSQFQAAILDLVRARPGVTQAELAGQLGTPRQNVHYNVKRLRQAGILRLEGWGRNTRCYPAAAA
jgi:DNA-binding MarR family transcriptional regulator